MVELQMFASGNEAEMLLALEEDGACILLDALPVGLCNQLLADFSVHLDQQQVGVDELGYRENFYGAQTKRLHGLFSKSKHMESILLQPSVLELAERMLVATNVAKGLRLSNTELMVLHQGQTQQVFHSDAGSWQLAQRLEQRELLVSANYALTDFRQSNGATCVVPGSQRWPAERKPKPDEICHAVMPQGSALVYTGNVLHAGGANLEHAPRVGLYLGYVASWLRPLENHLLTNHPDDILGLSEVARQLLDLSPGGFTVYA